MNPGPDRIKIRRLNVRRSGILTTRILRRFRRHRFESLKSAGRRQFTGRNSTSRRARSATHRFITLPNFGTVNPTDLMRFPVSLLRFIEGPNNITVNTTFCRFPGNLIGYCPGSVLIRHPPRQNQMTGPLVRKGRNTLTAKVPT